MPPKRNHGRAMCFTFNEPKEDSDRAGDFWAIDPERFGPGIKYAVWQLEIGAEGTVHYQGYAAFNDSITYARAKQLLDIADHAHMDVALGTAEDNKRYCSKPGALEGPFEYGSIAAVGQGKRSDLVAAASSAADLTKSMVDVILEHPSVAMRYGRGLETYRQAALVKQMRTTKGSSLRRAVQTVVYWGPPGTGKTFKAQQELDAFWLPPATAEKQPVWFDGYLDQSTLIIDEFTPQRLPLSLLLNILDGAPIQLPKKGGFVQPSWRKVVITSNFHPQAWYPDSPADSIDALKRRLTQITKCVSPPARFGQDSPSFRWNDADDEVIDLTNE